jgi:hypothetical protein
MDRFHSTAAAARSAWSWRRSQACSAAAALVVSGLCGPAPSSRPAARPTPPRYRSNWVGRWQRIDVTGVRPVRPGRDRARPVGPRAVSWFRSNGRGWTAGLKLCAWVVPPPAAALIPVKAKSATQPRNAGGKRATRHATKLALRTCTARLKAHRQHARRGNRSHLAQVHGPHGTSLHPRCPDLPPRPRPTRPRHRRWPRHPRRTTHLATRQTVSDRHDGHAGAQNKSNPASNVHNRRTASLLLVETPERATGIETRIASLEDCAHCAVRGLDLRLGRVTVTRC